MELCLAPMKLFFVKIQIFSIPIRSSFPCRPRSSPPKPQFVSEAPTIGAGVHVQPSTIPKHGLGLFASRPFHRGEVVTFYDGFIIEKEMLWSENLFYQPGSHTLTLLGSNFAVQGLQHPWTGMGGGAFINHRPLSRANCVYFCLGKDEHSLEYSLPGPDDLDSDLDMCVLVATRPISSGEEFFADYGFETCAILGIPYDHPDFPVRIIFIQFRVDSEV